MYVWSTNAHLTETGAPLWPRTLWSRRAHPRAPRPNQATDEAVGKTFGEMLETEADAFSFFSYCLAQRSTSRGERMRKKAAKRIADKKGIARTSSHMPF